MRPFFYSILGTSTFALLLASLASLASLPALAWHPLNDTGIQFCGEATSGNNDPCTGSEPQGQDAHYGRDAAARAGTLTKVGAGAAGFDFTKISNSGQVLQASATLGSGPNDWACTRDNVTGLLWEVKIDSASHLRHKDHTYTWYFTSSPDDSPGFAGNTSSCRNTLAGQNCNTENYAARVNATGLCGYTSGWRVPTVKELESIVHQGWLPMRANPAIDTGYFPNTHIPAGHSSNFWSASPSASLSNNAWVVWFSGGASGIRHRSSGGRVRLVHGGPSIGTSAQADHCTNNAPPSNPDSIYTIHGNGSTVTDTRTGLMWKRCAEGQTWDGSSCSGESTFFTWASALAHAKSHVFAGHEDWRIPNIKELRSLVEECRSGPSINDTIFPNTSSSYFWSASPGASYSDYAWSVYFSGGNSYDGSRYPYTRVRLARGGQANYGEATDFQKAETLFNWMESLPQSVFTGAQGTQQQGGLIFRQYAHDVRLSTYQGNLLFTNSNGITVKLGSVQFWLPYAQAGAPSVQFAGSRFFARPDAQSSQQNADLFTNAQWVTSFYIAYLNRAADPSGLQRWSDILAQGDLSIPDVADSFVLSEEAQRLTPQIGSLQTAAETDRFAFLQALYRNLLNLTVSADSETIRGKAESLRTGATTPGEVVGEVILAAMQEGLTDWQTILNKVQVAEYFTQRFAAIERVWQDSDLDLARQALQGVTDDQDTVVDAKARVEQMLQ